jgi:hypothetical protein
MVFYSDYIHENINSAIESILLEQGRQEDFILPGRLPSTPQWTLSNIKANSFSRKPHLKEVIEDDEEVVSAVFLG